MLVQRHQMHSIHSDGACVIAQESFLPICPWPRGDTNAFCNTIVDILSKIVMVISFETECNIDYGMSSPLSPDFVDELEMKGVPYEVCSIWLSGTGRALLSSTAVSCSFIWLGCRDEAPVQEC